MTRRLEFDEDPVFQRRSWRLQRVGWVACGLVVAYGAVGGLGQGGISRQNLSSPSSRLHIEFDCIVYAMTDATLLVTASSVDPAPHELVIYLSPDYFRSMSCERIQPEPARIVSDGRMAFHFQVLPRATQLQVRFELHPRQAGRVPGWVALDDGDRIDFSQWVAP